ncbi:MAG: hypothetical protein K2X52_06625 [Mycobacteriaceae bacterium]|nr:hypothetical protein [Mycobacteriaceae bacterium]
MKVSVAAVAAFVLALAAMPQGVAAMMSLAGGIILVIPVVAVVLVVARALGRPRQGCGQAAGHGVGQYPVANQFVNAYSSGRDVYGMPTAAPVWPAVWTGPSAGWQPPTPPPVDSGAGVRFMQQRRRPCTATLRVIQHGGERR